MKRFSKKTTWVIASAALVCMGSFEISPAATTIANDQSAVVDGWNITAPADVSLTVTTSNSEILIEKAANFTQPNQGFQVAFQPVAGAGSPASSIDFTDETIQNNTGQAFSGFDFILLNTGTANATFAGPSNEFKPPVGTGYSYSSVNLNSTDDILAYTGTQNAGTTSSWGSATPGDNLLINAPAGADFSLKELSVSGSGGIGGGGVSSVPLAPASSQSLVALAALGLITVTRRIKRRLAQPRLA